MVKTKEQAAAAYRRGVDNFGVENYAKCGNERGRGFLAVAKCLEDAKRTSLTLDSMVSKYTAAAEL